MCAQIVCDFRRQFLEFTPDARESYRLKLRVELADVALYSVTPAAKRTLRLTLKDSAVMAALASPASGGAAAVAGAASAALPPGSNPRECEVKFSAQKFDDIAAEVVAAFAFRSGSFDTDFVRVPVSACFCVLRACACAYALQALANAVLTHACAVCCVRALTCLARAATACASWRAVAALRRETPSLQSKCRKSALTATRNTRSRVSR